MATIVSTIGVNGNDAYRATQALPKGHGSPVTDRYTLIATKVAPAGMAQGYVPNFAGSIPPNSGTDPGRQWSGDAYTTGAATDPTQGFAHFSATDGSDVDAWLDKHDDGTLCGWVRDGKSVWRYTDPRTWGDDVDAAGMERVDANAPAEGDEVATAPENDTTEPANQTSSDFVPELPPSTDATAAPAPTATATDVPDDQNPFLADDSAKTDAAAGDLNDAQLAKQQAAPGETPTPQDPNVDPNVDSNATPPAPPAQDPNSGVPADPAAAPVDPEDAADGGADEATEDDKKKKPWEKTEKKHLPGQHDQKTHGDWAHGIHVNHTHDHTGLAIALPSGGGGSGPKASEPAVPAPAKDKIDPASLEHLSPEALNGIWDSGQDIYDTDTLTAIAKMLDAKDDQDKLMRANAPADAAGRAGMFSTAVPDRYVEWVARTDANMPKAKAPNRRQEVQDAYQNFIDSQYIAAEAATRGTLWSNAGKAWANGRDPINLFNGVIPRTQVKKYASEELLRWFAEHPRLTFTEFAAEFYPSYAKAAAKTKNAYLSEHG